MSYVEVCMIVVQGINNHFPPGSIDNYLGPHMYHDANQCPSQLRTCKASMKFPANSLEYKTSVAHPGWPCSYMQECFDAEEGILPA